MGEWSSYINVLRPRPLFVVTNKTIQALERSETYSIHSYHSLFYDCLFVTHGSKIKNMSWPASIFHACFHAAFATWVHNTSWERAVNSSVILLPGAIISPTAKDRTALVGQIRDAIQYVGERKDLFKALNPAAKPTAASYLERGSPAGPSITYVLMLYRLARRYPTRAQPERHRPSVTM